METFIGQVLAGLSSGSVYAGLALALVMIYQATHHINFAQGEMAMFSTFIAWTLIQAGLNYWLAFALTVVISFVIGGIVQYAVIRPMGNAPALSLVVVFIGLLVIFHSLAGMLFGYMIQPFPSPFSTNSWYAGFLLPAHQMGALFVTSIVVAILFTFFKFTSVGLSMRAAAENPASARLVGINVGAMLVMGWGLAAAIGAVAGMMVAPIVFLDPHMMTGVLMYAFAGALLGGIDSPLGAVIGGLLVGVLENLLGTYVVSTDLKLTVALVLIVMTLIVCPAGLFGRKVVARV